MNMQLSNDRSLKSPIQILTTSSQKSLLYTSQKVVVHFIPFVKSSGCFQFTSLCLYYLSSATIRQLGVCASPFVISVWFF